jgi:uncharacterized membrane protein
MQPTMNRLRSERTLRYVLEGVAVLLIAILASAGITMYVTRPPIPYTQETATVGETVRARVDEVVDETDTVGEDGLVEVAQTLTLRILSRGPHRDETVTVDYNGSGPTLSAVRFAPGEQALVMISTLPASAGVSGRTVYQVADHVRLLPLALVTAAFALVTVGIGRWQGVRALIGLLLSGVLIGGFVLPQILALRDPMLVALVSTGLLLAVTLYLIQGWNPTGHAALLGMTASLAATGVLAVISTKVTYLTGFGSEETLYLQAVGVAVQMRGLLLAGMILGAAGVLDDVILAQAVTVFELSATDRTLHSRELYRRGMRVGVTHLTSMINTLVLAYASTALPLLILFYLYPEPWYLTINRELIAEEIVRALVGSTGLMLAVPLTTAVAAWAAPRLGSAHTADAAKEQVRPRFTD